MKRTILAAWLLVSGAVLFGMPAAGLSAQPSLVASPTPAGEIDITVPANPSDPLAIIVGMHPSAVDKSETYMIEVDAADSAAAAPQELGVVSFFPTALGVTERFAFTVPAPLAQQAGTSGHLHVWVRILPIRDGAPALQNSQVTIDSGTVWLRDAP